MSGAAFQPNEHRDLGCLSMNSCGMLDAIILLACAHGLDGLMYCICTIAKARACVVWKGLLCADACCGVQALPPKRRNRNCRSVWTMHRTRVLLGRLLQQSLLPCRHSCRPPPWLPCTATARRPMQMGRGRQMSRQRARPARSQKVPVELFNDLLFACKTNF